MDRWSSHDHQVIIMIIPELDVLCLVNESSLVRIKLWSQELWKREFVLKPAKKCHSILSSKRPIFDTRMTNCSFQSRIVSQNLPTASPRSSNMSVSAQHWKATMFEIFGKKTRTFPRLPSKSLEHLLIQAV